MRTDPAPMTAPAAPPVAAAEVRTSLTAGLPGTVVAVLTARAAARSALGWGAAFGLWVVTSALAYTATYRTPLSRARLAATTGASPAFSALNGSAHQIGTVAGFVAWRSVGVLAVVGGVWGLLAGTRLLRGEEEAGRWENLLAGWTTRRAAAGQAIAGLGAGLLVLWAVTALATVLVGRVHSVGLGVGPSLFLALTLVCGPAIFLAGGALAGQLAPTRRQGAGYAGAVLGGCLALRMIADGSPDLAWLRWCTPLGWIELLHPLTSPDPVLLLPIGALVAVTAGVAIALAGARDLGASLVPDRSHVRARLWLLSGPVGLDVRLARGVLAGWALGIGLAALLMGLIARSAGNLLAGTAGDRESFARLGLRGSGTQQYLAVSFLVSALLVAFVAAGQVGAARIEEASGRLDHLLVRPVSRDRWLGGRVAVAAAGLVVAGLIAGLCSWIGAAVGGAGVGPGVLLAAGVNAVPPAVVVLGAGVLTLGLWPRAVPLVGYGLVAWSLLLEILGGVVRPSHWLLDTSLFHQMAAAPAIRPDWTTDAILIALGIAAAGAGTVAFRHRDLVGE